MTRVESFALVRTLVLLLLVHAPGNVGAVPDLTHMRALHVTGNWGGNITGIRTAVAGLLDAAPSISASSVQATMVRGSFVDNTGTTHTNDSAVVRLTGVSVGSSSFAQAAFWVGRDIYTGNAFLQFMPTYEPSLAAMPGFAGDITMGISPDGSTIDTNMLSLASGTARDYVLAVLAHGSELMRAASFSLQPPATLDEPSVENLLRAVSAQLQSQSTEYWDFLKAENVQWIGLSVAMFNSPITSPDVQLRYRPAGAVDYDTYTFDDADLQNFISKAKRLGFKVYLTLAFEPGGVNIPPSAGDPTCNTDRYVVNRAFFGEPRIDASNPLETCMNPSYWWWDPAHPEYAANVARFWSTYTQIAVKYASLCQKLGVDMFSLGTESDGLFRTRASATWPNDFKAQLTTMVAAVRAVYSGLVTYDQSYAVLRYPYGFDGAVGESALFLDIGLDVVGVSAYFDLAAAPVSRVLSVAELESSWEKVFTTYLEPLQAANPGKPIVFLEFGYVDDVDAPAQPQSNVLAPEPAMGPSGMTDGMQQQANIYQSFFNVDESHGNLVKGAFLWGNGVFTNYSADCTQIGDNIHCKPSAKTIASIYAKWDHPFQGLWWNPSESGWGVSVTQHGSVAFNALYSYDTAGQPVWYVMSDCAFSGNQCTGSIYKVIGGAPPTGPWNGNNLSVAPAGSGTMSFAADANSASFAFTINGVSGSKSLSRQLFGSGAGASAVDYTDLWWNSGESGWGIALTQQAPTIFATWYSYDALGQPRWYMASNCAMGDKGCSGDLYEVAGGSIFTVPWGPSALVVNRVGTLSITFTDAFNGSMSYTIGGASQTRPISRQSF